jgi:hypothetical protein
MGFLSGLHLGRIASGFKRSISTVTHGLKKAANTVYHKALKPLYSKVIKPAYTKVIKPVAERAIKFVKHSVDRVEHIADAGVKGIEAGAGLLDTISKSPMIILGFIGVGALFALK